MLSPEELACRARARCKHRRRGVGGVCQDYYLAEGEQAPAEKHLELELDEVLALVQEWLRTVDERFTEQ